MSAMVCNARFRAKWILFAARRQFSYPPPACPGKILLQNLAGLFVRDFRHCFWSGRFVGIVRAPNGRGIVVYGGGVGGTGLDCYADLGPRPRCACDRDRKYCDWYRATVLTSSVSRVRTNEVIE